MGPALISGPPFNLISEKVGRVVKREGQIIFVHVWIVPWNTHDVCQFNRYIKPISMTVQDCENTWLERKCKWHCLV